MAHHFVRELGARLGKGEPGFSADARDALLTYRWPGNIRELENAIERALIITEGGLLTARHLGLGGGEEARPAVPDGGATEAKAAPEPLATLEQRAILAALESTRGNKTQAAALLGITRTQLHTRLKRFGLAAKPTV